MNTVHPLIGRERRPFLNRKFPDVERLERQLSRRTLRDRLSELFSNLNFRSLLHPFSSEFASDKEIPRAQREAFSRVEAIEILAVGNQTMDQSTHKVLRTTPWFRLCSTSDPRTLWLIPKQQTIHVIVLHTTLSPDQLGQVGRLARHRWPLARILVIRAGEEFLEDALYDDRISPSVAPSTLVATIERMAVNVCKGRLRI